MMSLARRILDRIRGRHVLEQALAAEHAAKFARDRLESLRLVKSDAEGEGFYTALDPNEKREIKLFRSGFNLAWIAEFGITPKFILDIGSYDGGDAVRFKLAFPSATVCAFEADSDMFAIASRNAKPFGVEMMCAAVSDHDGNAPWYSSTDMLHGHDGRSGGQGSLFPHSVEYTRRYQHIKQSEKPSTIQTLTIRTFCAERALDEIDIAHIDVEGAEFEVISGFGARRPKLVFVETLALVDAALWNGAKTSRDVHSLLSRMGYMLAGDFMSDRLYVQANIVSRQ